MNKLTALYVGKKNLWCQRWLVDITILQHEKLTKMNVHKLEYTPYCIEIVSSSPSVSGEALHMYLSYNKLCNKCEEVDPIFQDAGSVPSTARSSSTKDLIIDYILKRLSIEKIATEGSGAKCSSFKIILTPLENDDVNDEGKSNSYQKLNLCISIYLRCYRS